MYVFERFFRLVVDKTVEVHPDHIVCGICGFFPPRFIVFGIEKRLSVFVDNPVIHAGPVLSVEKRPCVHEQQSGFHRKSRPHSSPAEISRRIPRIRQESGSLVEFPAQPVYDDRPRASVGIIQRRIIEIDQLVPVENDRSVPLQEFRIVECPEEPGFRIPYILFRSTQFGARVHVLHKISGFPYCLIHVLVCSIAVRSARRQRGNLIMNPCGIETVSPERRGCFIRTWDADRRIAVAARIAVFRYERIDIDKIFPGGFLFFENIFR